MFHILVVDDDKNTRKFIRVALEIENYTVYTAENGEEALEKIDKNQIDLVILDIMMPKIDGYKCTELIRLSKNNLPIMMISAKQLPEDKKKGFQLGIDDFMTKPIDVEELVLRIKALLRRAQIINEQKIFIGNIILDYQAMSVINQDEITELPQKEFQLLYKLLSYPGKIFTRIQLMDDIWGLDSDSGWETVTVHIGRLRKKLENIKEFEIISVRGLGYKAVKHI